VETRRIATYAGVLLIIDSAYTLFSAVNQLNVDIRAWIETWNENPRPYVWTKTADEILDSIAHYCTRINDSRH
jgi:hypothetical protein